MGVPCSGSDGVGLRQDRNLTFQLPFPSPISPPISVVPLAEVSYGPAAHTHAHTRTRTRTRTHARTHAHTHARTHTRTHTHTLTHSLTHSITHSHTLTDILAPRFADAHASLLTLDAPARELCFVAKTKRQPPSGRNEKQGARTVTRAMSASPQLRRRAGVCTMTSLWF